MQQHDRLALAAVDVVDLHAVEVGVFAVLDRERRHDRETKQRRGAAGVGFHCRLPPVCSRAKVGANDCLCFGGEGGISNPRYGCPYAAFRVRCIQPLCHLSGPNGGLAPGRYVAASRSPDKGAVGVPRVYRGAGARNRLSEHDLVRKPVSTFRDHAYSSRPSTRSTEYGPPPRSAIANASVPHIITYS